MTAAAKAKTLTIGMAHFDDYDGVYFTLQSLSLYHALGQDVELIVVDNSPHTVHGRGVADLCAKTGVRYVPLTDVVGTSAPRNQIFQEAAGEIVVVMDCHVLLRASALQAVRSYFRDAAAHARDIVSGPLMTDDHGLYGTHFNDVWRAEMWGVWGLAWRCNCDRPLHFSPLDAGENKIRYVHLVTQQCVTACPNCGQELPADIGWAAHERQLYDRGYRCLADAPDKPPFVIPGMGLGCFAMRRDAWPGFNPHARGFGGEELYIHEKVRRAGGRAICHPGFAWVHRFGRPGGVRYQLSRYDKARNYVLEFRELALPLDPIRDHFVGQALLTDADWDYLTADPIAHVTPPNQPAAKPGCKNCNQPVASALPQPPAGEYDVDTLYNWCAAIPRDLEKHAPKIRELASQADHVTWIVKRREWAPFLLAGRPKTAVEYTTERDKLHDLLHATIQATEVNPRAPRRISNYATTERKPAEIQTIDPTDLLVIDTVHHADVLYAELERWAPFVRRRIILRGTATFGETAEGGGPGLLVALRRYLRKNPDWSVIFHTAEQYGLTVVSRDQSDKPRLPGVITMASNLVSTLSNHVAMKCAHVTHDQLQARLEVCTLCTHRTGNRCGVCGCWLEKKAPLRAADCPIALWPVLPPSESPQQNAADGPAV